jgi:outer membrane protein TolC
MQERIAQAVGGRAVAFAEFLPEAKVSVRPIAGDTNVGGYALPTIPTYTGNVAFGGIGERFNLAELNVQWILWDFGRTPGRYGQAVTQVEISRLQYDRARQTVAFNVTTAYFQVLQARALRIVAQEAVVRADSVVRDAESFLKRGVGIRNDLLRAQTLLAEMQLNVIKAKTAEGIAVAALNQAMGINVGCPTEIVDRSQEPSFALGLSESLQLASDHREEFGVVVRAIRSARLGANVASADFMPRVLVGGVAAHQDSNQLKNANLVAGGLTIEMALFEGGRRLGKLQTAEADVRAAIAQGKEVCDKIAYEVHTAFLLIDDAKQRLVLARAIVVKAQENLRVVRSLFSHGDATPTEVVDGELAMTRGQQDQFTAAYDYQMALARLAYAAGLPILTDFAALGGMKP